MPHTPMARRRAEGSMCAAAIRVRPAGARIAAPTPCTKRATMSSGPFTARPAARLATVNPTRPITSIRRRPNRSFRRAASSKNPPNVTRYAAITHCIASAVRPRSSRIVGSATFTTRSSKTIISCVTAATAVTAHNGTCRLISGDRVGTSSVRCMLMVDVPVLRAVRLQDKGTSIGIYAQMHVSKVKDAACACDRVGSAKNYPRSSATSSRSQRCAGSL